MHFGCTCSSSLFDQATGPVDPPVDLCCPRYGAFPAYLEVTRNDEGDSSMAISGTEIGGTYHIWLVVWNMNIIFPFSWACHNPN